uniref:Protein FRA10AC1 homolog n=1 Tax=Phallusia mammillata TaxID=59560 RepID=A0A6F9DDQ4_9ASCI|nr:protein FRA10AC1 homolog [Phallusia mammillata]
MSSSKVNYEAVNDYGSEFSDFASDSEIAKRKENRKTEKELLKKPNLGHVGLLHSGKSNNRAPSKRVAVDLLDKEEGKRMRYHGILAMDAYTRHQKIVNDYLFLYGGKSSDFKRDSSKDKTDHDVIKENHQFLWEDDESVTTWERKLAKKYWDKLFKEYTICDLSRYKENKIALRWRIEKEVISGKGQFICGNKKCQDKEGLRSWEVNFAYVEANIKKNALVKLRLCPECSYKLNYHHKRKDVTGHNLKSPSKQKKKKKKKHKKHKTDSDSSSSDDSPGTSSLKSSEKQDEEEHEIWSKPVQVEEEKSREEEFDEYFQDLFL